MRNLSLLLLFAASSLPAQIVSPSYYTSAEGSANNVFPFGNTTVPFRFSQVHDGIAPGVILGMAFRHNAGGLTPTVYPGHSVTIDAWVSTAVTTAATASGTFDNNHGADKMQVIVNRTYTHPASNQPDVPGQFVLDYAFDFPFVFGGTGSLCWEVQVTAKTQTTSIIHDACSVVANPPLQVWRAYSGCLATGRTATMLLTPGSTMSWPTATGTLTANGSQLLANGAVFYLFGFDKNFWAAGATPLPAVIPTTTGSPSGTCSLYTDILSSSLALASATGTTTLAIALTPDPSYHGMTLYSQILGLDAAANPYGVTSTNLAIYNFSAPFAVNSVARIFASGNLGPTGTASLASTLVTKFY